jgi:type I restriction enzyme, S subunit
MAKWPKVKLIDCVNLLAGFPFKSQQFTDKPDDVPLVKGENVSQGRILWDISKRWPASDWKKMEKFHLVPGDVVVAMDRPWIPAGLKWSVIRQGDPRALLVQRCARLRSSNERLDQRFLRFVIGGSGFENYVKPITTGVNVPHISGQQILDFEFTLPPVPIQRRIADILSAYDELIENSQRRIKILESMARALYREWFVHFRFPGHESIPRVASPLGDIPKGWEVRALGEVCSRITDGSHVSPQSVESGYPMASVKDMHDWGINVESCRRITIEDYENLVRNDCKPLKNDVLIAKDGSYLKHTFVVREERDLVILSSIAMLRPNDLVRPSYLCFALRDPVTKARMQGIVSGVAIPRIVLKDFRKFQILVPSQAAQAAWIRIIDPMIEICGKLVAQIENLRRTRDLLLPRLLSGQIDVSKLSQPVAA